jgi:biotin carboxyl carrier protein
LTLSRGGRLPSRLAVRVEETTFIVEMDERPTGGLDVRIDGRPVEVDARLSASGGSLLLDGVSYVVDLDDARGGTQAVVDGQAFRVQIEGDGVRRRGAPAQGSPGGGQRLVAPMPGKVAAVLVEVGQVVERGAGLVVLEAMKMENEFQATARGTVREIHVEAGQAVNAGDLLVVIA